MDPLTVTATFITLATFIKDLIEVGESIHRSIEKVRYSSARKHRLSRKQVSENRRQIRELTEDVLRALNELANLTRGREGVFQGPELLSALESLKAEMLYVHSKCRKISPVQLPGFRGVSSQLKAWRKRDNLEGKIARLKERVSKCYSQFTAFSAARIEQTTLRMEQTLIVNNVENQVKARRLEGMVAQLLLDTEFGQNIMNQTIEIISCDPTHQSLESQYLSVQTLHLIDSFQQLLPSGKLVLDGPLWESNEPFQPTFRPNYPHLHVLHDILGMFIKIKESSAICIPLGHMHMCLGVDLHHIGMIPESIAWERLKIRILRYLGGGDYGTSLEIAHALRTLSTGYGRRLQFQPALQASQQSLNLWDHIAESLPEVDNRLGHLEALNTHSINLLDTGHKIAALSTAKDAVALSRPMAEQLDGSGSGLSLTEEEKVTAVFSCDALFILAKILASLDQHLESYEASKEGFSVRLRLPVFIHPPSGLDIDLFINEICQVAEEDRFSLAMLADCVTLFGNLARIHSEQFSSQFLWLLHAYAYFAKQDDSCTSSSMKNTRIFLEPNSDRPPPPLNISGHVDLRPYVEDAIRAFYTRSSENTFPLIRKIIVTHLDQAIVVLRHVVEKSASNTITIQWVLYTINNVVPFLSSFSRVALLQVSTRTIEHFNTVLTSPGSDWEWLTEIVLKSIFYHFWRAGLLDEALRVCEQVIKYLESRSNSDHAPIVTGWCLNRHSILCDMGRFSNAIETIQRMETMPQSCAEAARPNPLKARIPPLKARILRRVGRNHEALQLLRREVTAVRRRKSWNNNDKVFDLQLYFSLVELAATLESVGWPEKAIKAAERTAAACRKGVDDNYVEEEQKCTLVRSLTTLSNCLAAVGRHDEALGVAQEAVSIYVENAPYMWGYFLTPRKEELGANAFYALSLRLTTSGDRDQAIINAEKATELYRELVTLAPRHLPTLASSLRNLASILSAVGRRRGEAVAACEEAVSILRKVVDPKTYLLPSLAEALDQLAGYFHQNSNTDGAAAATAECAQVRRTFASLPPEPEFLFEKVVIVLDGEDDEDAEDRDSGSEEDEDWDDALDAPTSVEVPDAATGIPECPVLSAEHFPGGLSIDTQSCKPQIPEGDTAIPSATTKLITEAEAPSRPDKTAIASVMALNEGLATTDTAISVWSSSTDILSKPLDVKLSFSMRMRSTPMDILWWILLGILVAVVGSRAV